MISVVIIIISSIDRFLLVIMIIDLLHHQPNASTHVFSVMGNISFTLQWQNHVVRVAEHVPSHFPLSQCRI
jgi:hypothetical protein